MLPSPPSSGGPSELARAARRRHGVVRRRRAARACWRRRCAAAAGVARVLASTHGHEVGWSMLPGARQALRRIGRDADVVTTVTRYTRGRIAAALGPDAALEPLPLGHRHPPLPRPTPAPARRSARRHGLGDAPVVTCVSRLVRAQGPGRADPRAAADPRRGCPARALLHRRRRTRPRPAARASPRAHDVADARGVHRPGAARRDLPAHHAAGDVFALPCRTLGRRARRRGARASCCWRRRRAGCRWSRAAPGAPRRPSRRRGATGHVVDGRDPADVADALVGPARRPGRAPRAMGAAGPARGCRRTGPGRSRARRLAALARPA